ncbi:MAG: SDR family NAD(P)-dependent oxidoreductase [Candidatus Caccovivens sp.]
MKRKLQNKIAVISGGSSGIGLAISKCLKAEGVKIYNISKNVSNESIFEKSYQVDISDDERVKIVIDEILSQVSKIDLLFCNAGFGIGGLVENADIQSIDSIMNVNLIAHMKMANLFAKNINEGGKIVFTGSLASIIPLPYQACYSASKAGIESFSRALATELKPRKVSVTTIMPGDINTNFTANRIKQTGDNKKEMHGIEKMEKAEKKGKSADFVAKRVVKIVKKKHPPLRVSIGGSSKLLSLLVKLLPVKFVNFLVEKIYI